MTVTNSNVLASSPAHSVQTRFRLNIFHVAKVVVIQRHWRFRIYILQVPSEALAFELLSELYPLGDVAHIDASRSYKKIQLFYTP